MSLDADTIVDRRRMRRKLSFWRVLAILVAIVALFAVGAMSGRDGEWMGGGDHIARVHIEGLIRGNQDRIEAIDHLAKVKSVKAVVLHIDSPGGTTAGSEQLYDAFTRLKASKPLVVVVDGLCASGGYITALSSDRIIARSSSLVGSIGVLIQYPNVGDLLKTVGVKVEEVKSSPLKASPNGFEPTSPEARAALEALVKDSYAWFRGLVQERRKLDDGLLGQVADGRVFTGRQALPLKLIDEIGDEKTALAWLAKEKGVSEKLDVRDYKLDQKLRDLPFLHAAAAYLLEAAGLGALAEQLRAWGTAQAIEKLNLDGLLALWHPSLAH